ncbi:MAG: TetR/AcrR family transcriptional regulator [Myxococcota bacterium]|nr:TetR/AcrR family transcriptional regulator [Myxococcota bacterium]
MAPGTVAAGDGRTDRRLLRSRRAICDACLDLVQEGVLQPSADQVAERAGLSRRSIFYHFRDLAELYDAVVEAGMQRCAPLLREVPATLPLEARVAQMAEVRARFFEATAPFARALAAQSLVGAGREQARRVAREALAAQRADVARVFAPELDGLAPAARAERLEALAAAASAPTWEMLRRSRGLSVARARAVVARTLSALLAARA